MQRKLKSTKSVSLQISILLFLASLAIVQKCVEFLKVEALEKNIHDRNNLLNSNIKTKDHHKGKKSFSENYF